MTTSGDSWHSPRALRADAQYYTAALAAASSELYREITAEQNAKWAERIREMLVDDDVEFVSLDVAHLVGPDNVLSRLRAEAAQVQKR